MLRVAMSAYRSAPVNRDQLGELPGLTLSGHSLDYGVQKVCVPKTSEAVEKLFSRSHCVTMIRGAAMPSNKDSGSAHS